MNNAPSFIVHLALLENLKQDVADVDIGLSLLSNSGAVGRLHAVDGGLLLVSEAVEDVTVHVVRPVTFVVRCEDTLATCVMVTAMPRAVIVDA